jgi:hypothetical protein
LSRLESRTFSSMGGASGGWYSANGTIAQMSLQTDVGKYILKKNVLTHLIQRFNLSLLFSTWRTNIDGTSLVSICSNICGTWSRGISHKRRDRKSILPWSLSTRLIAHVIADTNGTDEY